MQGVSKLSPNINFELLKMDELLNTLSYMLLK